jgi:hypothetical protein
MSEVSVERLFSVAIRVFIGDEGGHQSHDRSVSLMVYVLAKTTKEANEKALVAPEVVRCIGDPVFDKAEVLVAGAVPKNILKKFLS